MFPLFRKMFRDRKEKQTSHTSSGGYQRDTDCWNCGSREHMKKECPMPGSLKCSRCRRKGVRSDECDCSRNEDTHWYETAVLLNVEGRYVRTVINTINQETRMGEGVLEYLRSKRAVNLARQVVKTDYGVETLQGTDVRMGDSRHSYIVRVIVDRNLPKFEMIIGFHGLIRLGYRLTVCGIESRQRRRPKERARESLPPKKLKMREDDSISFLDENEAKRIREWID